MKITDRFLKAKHWQLFVLIFGVPFVFQLTMMGYVIAEVVINSQTDPRILFEYMNYLPWLALIPFGILFGWFWSIAINLQKKIPSDVTMKVKKFKLFFFIPVVYILLFVVFISFILMETIMTVPDPSIGLIGPLLVLIIPLHLFSMFCILYTFYFIAKTIKTVELQRDVVFNDFIAEFFLLWFYPIGIWILQPKINKMVQ